MIIKNPYESVESLLKNKENHYRTNLHTHSTVSDADVDYRDMILGYYNEGFDILGFADHGVLGTQWNDPPTSLPLYRYQQLKGRKVHYLTNDEYSAIINGTYPPANAEKRTYGRGMHCFTSGIELNMVTLTKSHVNGYFCDFGENNFGFENGFRYAVKNVDKAGGVSVINHPGDWIDSSKDFSRAENPKTIRLFGDIFNDYTSCAGMEIFNECDTVVRADRILWDNILQYVIPHGKRNVFGFANSDAHCLENIDTSFMDFILPEYSGENMRKAMTEGTFFAIGRFARPELGNDFRGTGAYPKVTEIEVDSEKHTISVKGINAEKIQWIANGKVLSEYSTINENGELESVFTIDDFDEDITCYVRFQLSGKGGMCIAQPFIIDKGNLSDYIIKDTRSDFRKKLDSVLFNLKSLRFAVIIDEIIKIVRKK